MSIKLSDHDEKIIRQILADQLPDYEIWAFGSRVHGRHLRIFSDLDLVIRDETKPLDDVRYAALKDALAESDLSIRVDVALWHPLPDWLKQDILSDYDVMQDTKKLRQQMTLDELRTKHKADILRITGEYGMENVRVFGSIARGQAHENSDLDLLVTLTKPVGWGYAGCQLDLEHALAMRVDLISDRGLSPRIGPHILHEAVPL